MAGRKGEKIWADAVRRAVMRRLDDEEGKPQKIERLADKLVDLATDGDVTALKEIGDRLDGKPRQQTEIGGIDGDDLVITKIVRTIIDPQADGDAGA